MWYDVKWRRPGDPEVLECHGLTGDQLVFRIRGVIRMCGSVELLSVKFSKAPPPQKEPSDARDLAYADGYNDGFRQGKQSRIAGPE